ncbi:DEAD/DEAH box helicase [Streptomyces tsukubensis]|uniref:RNA helicase n=1 Tax=Streptomyces tsukubensis TaxID=83656 RepID=A0A1V4A5F7_9ACTN|nr:DEAD/DEAH box helicase [Streptomyces tsukubensis]OON75628.1 RNA helicase [Streptomyces tsukubensis]QFR94390.1 DEAD/DEAH box helicase [Streptomyces tsukubensis]
MSVSSTDHAVVPENDQIVQAVAALDEAVEAVEQATAAVADAPVTDLTESVEVSTSAAESSADESSAADSSAKEPSADEDAPEAVAADEADGDDEVTFASLGLPEGVVRKLGQNGVTKPFPIQAATIPDALAGKDILGRGRTGSGKTLSFGLPLLATLAGGHTEKKKPRGVILTPTRELAMQVADALQPYGDVLGLKMKVVCGGTSMGNQIYALERGVDVLVATPGRLRDIINRGACSLSNIEIAVLDEADQMADLGFMPEVTELLDQIPSGGQRMLFSATLENEIDSLVKRYLVDPVHHEVDAAQGAVTTMSHHILIVKPRDKAPVTAAIASRKGRTITFVRTQLGADRVAEQLREAGAQADALHGGMTQGARTRTLADFKDGYVNVLVATDVAARGIHVDDVDLVLNVDPAGDHKDYLHRSGRTARAGRSGTVVSLALPHQRRQIFRLMEDAGVDATRHMVNGGAAFEPEVAEITGARSMTEVQAESAGQAAKQAEREVTELTRDLERAQRRFTELREEADRLTARAARERGEDPEAAVAAVAESAEPVAESAPAVVAEVPAPAAERPAYSKDRRDDRRDERPAYNKDRRDDRPSFNRDRRDERPSYNRDRRDDRGGDRGGRPTRDDRGNYGRERRDERPSFNRDRRDDRGGDRPSFNRDRRDDRPSFNRDRRDERPSFNRDRGGSDRPSFNRDRRDDRGGDRPSFNRDRRDDRGGDRPSFNRDRRDDRGGDRPSFNRDRRDHRGGSDRPFNRDRSDQRGPSDRSPARRDDRGAGAGSSFRRDDKPRWKRNG